MVQITGPLYNTPVGKKISLKPLNTSYRYGNLDIIKYFFSLNFSTKPYGNYTLMHMTFFNDEILALKYLYEEQKQLINDLTYEIPPIKLAIKYESWHVVEYLVKNGAYYIDENGSANNFIMTKDEKNKEIFRDLKTNNEIKPNLVFDLR